jgi:hypothetical protein
VIHDKCFENSLTSSKVWMPPFKNDIISLFPKAPGTNQKNFHEERLPKINPGLQDLLVDT